MYKFIKSALVLVLFASVAVFGPEVQAKSVDPSAQSCKRKDVVMAPIVNQSVPGTVTGVWTVAPPGNLSTVYLMDLTNGTWQLQIVAGTTATFGGVVSGHDYSFSVSHGQNVKATAFVGH